MRTQMINTLQETNSENKKTNVTNIISAKDNVILYEFYGQVIYTLTLQ
jgi:hypothetical protein